MDEDVDVGFEARHLAARIQAGAPLGELRSALEPTWKTPERLVHSLVGAVNLRGPSLASRPDFSTSFYQDLVTRHLGRGALALVFRDPIAGWQELTYEALHEQSARLAATWITAGATPGQRIALVMPVGGPLALCLLTALRLGLIAVYLPPLGRSFVQHRLQTAAADRLVLTTGYAAWLGADPEMMLPDVPDPGAVPQLGLPPHGYAPDEPALEVFSLFGPASVDPVPRGAQSLLTRLAIDAELVLGLRNTDRLMAPDLDPLQHQPALMLTTLFAGACFIEAGARALEDEALANRLRPTVVGVTPALRERILEGAVATKGWRRWFKNPCDIYDWHRWETFGRRMTRAGAWGQNLVVSAAYGGAILFGPPQPEPQLEVLPGPGMAWALAESTLGRTVSSSDSGVLICDEEGAAEPTVGRFMMGDTGPALFVAGSADEGRSGTTYPVEEIVAAAEQHPAVDCASVVVNRAVRLMNDARIVLLIFVDPSRDPRSSAGQLSDELQELLRIEMGERLVPDQIRIYPLCPQRTEDDTTDHSWCRWQFLTGELQSKADDELFRLMSMARRTVVRALSEA